MPKIQGFQGAPSQGDPSKVMLALNIEVEDAAEAARVLARIQAIFDPNAVQPASNPQLAKIALEAERLRKEAEARREFEAAKERQQRAEHAAASKALEARLAEAEKKAEAEKDAEDVKAWEEAEAVAPAPRELEVVPDPAPVAGEVEVPKEPEPEPEKRPGLDPAAALAAYDEADATEAAPEVQQSAHYVKGGRYDGVEIVKVQTSKAQGFGVLTLVDGKKVKYDLASGHTIAVKGGAPLPEGVKAGDLEMAPTTRQDGPLAPAEDQPVEDSIGTPEGETPEWLAPVLEAKSVKAALVAASGQIEGDDLVEWAISMREKVPAFAKVNAKTFRKRVERAIATMAPTKKGATA